MEGKQPFLWGAATSAHQVEGHNVHNDWWHWEKRTRGAHRSGAAADHYHRFADDFSLAKSLGHNSHRLSIEWSRIEPIAGHWNTKEMQHYRQVLQALKELGFTTFVTLHHFTTPEWLAQKGGWENSITPEYFTRFARYVAAHLGDMVDFWITINEPMVYATQSYWHAKWPPQKRDLWGMYKVIKYMAQAHRMTYRALHQVRSSTPVGVASSVIAYVPEGKTQLDDQLIVRAQNWWYNHYFFSLTKRTHDFIGINYYFPRKQHVKILSGEVTNVPWSGPTSDLGWPIYPEGLKQVLLEMKRYRRPIYVTENGIADAKDQYRADFIRDHLRAVEAAQAEGADVRGYLHWALIDNFEWAEGFSPRFGLIEVDYATQERKVRPSAYVYQAIIEQSKQHKL